MNAVTFSTNPTFEVGAIRMQCLEDAFDRREIPNPLTVEDKELLQKIFDDLRNPAIDTSELFLALSIRQDFLAAIDSLTEEPKIAQLKKELAAFDHACLEFSHSAQRASFLPNPDQYLSDDKVRFSKRLRLTSFIFTPLPLPKELKNSLTNKLSLWNHLVSSPEYVYFANMQFAVEAKRLEQAKMEKTPFLESVSAIADASLLSKEKMLELSISYVELLKNYYEKEGPTKALLLGAPVIELLTHLHTELTEMRKSGQYSWQKLRDLIQKIQQNAEAVSKSASSFLENLSSGDPSQIIPYTSCNQCHFALVRLFLSLKLARDDIQEYLVPLRLFSNLTSYLDIPNEIAGIECSDSQMKSEFAQLCQKIPNRAFLQTVKEYLSNHPSFNDMQTPDELQKACCSGIFRTSKMIDSLPELQALHRKYSLIAKKLSPREAEKLENTYRQFCSALLPMFFCLADIESLRKPTLSSEDPDAAIVPISILRYFVLDSDIEEPLPQTPEIPKPLISSPSTPSPVTVAPSALTPLNQETFMDETDQEFLQLIKMVDRTNKRSLPVVEEKQNDAKSTPLSVVEEVKEESISVQQIPRKLRKLQRWVKEQFKGTKTIEGGRHTRLLSQNGSQMTVLPRHGELGRVHHAIKKQLTDPR